MLLTVPSPRRQFSEPERQFGRGVALFFLLTRWLATDEQRKGNKRLASPDAPLQKCCDGLSASGVEWRLSRAEIRSDSWRGVVKRDQQELHDSGKVLCECQPRIKQRKTPLDAALSPSRFSLPRSQTWSLTKGKATTSSLGTRAGRPQRRTARCCVRTTIEENRANKTE